MNINELEKHVKFDLIFTLLVCIGVGLCLLLTLAFIFKPINAKASTQLRETNITNSIYPYSNQCSGSQGNYCAFSVNNNNVYTFTINSNEYFNTNNIISFMFKVNYGMYQDAPSTITLEFGGTIANNGNYNCSIETTDGYTVSCTATRTASNKMNINFYTTSGATGLYQFWISNNGGINSSNNFSITKATLYQTTGSDNSDIINNANENAQDIMENANSNTNSTNNLITNFNDNMKELFQNCYKNYLVQSMIKSEDINMRQNGNTFTQITADTRPYPQQLVLQSYNNFTYVDTLSSMAVESAGTFTFYFTKTSSFNKLRFKFNGYTIDTGIDIDISSLTNGVTYYFTFSVTNITQGTLSFKNLLLTDKPSKSFIDFGTLYCTGNKFDSIEGAINGVQGGLEDTIDKLDEVKDIQQDMYDFWTDDTEPTVPTTDINNVLSSVNYRNPLDYLLTLPLNLMTKLNTVLSMNSCSRIDLGSFGGVINSQHIYLDCINVQNYLGSDLFTTIDTFMGIGLLVYIIYKLYETISNILTLGKEDEVKQKMSLPTPMEFLTMILGGGK